MNLNILAKISGILAIGACLLERPGDGENKKEELKEIVLKLLEILNFPSLIRSSTSQSIWS